MANYFLPQPYLISGQNIKTVGGESLLGSGDVDAVSNADLLAALANYATLVYVGATFAPIVHTHAISDVTGLQAALDGKAALSHTHGNITNAGAIGSTSNLPLITTTGGVVTTGSFGTTANTFCQGNDSRLSDARTPTSHVHGNISNAGAIGSTSGLPIITGASGVLQAGSFGTTAGTFAQGNDSRITNAAQLNSSNTFALACNFNNFIYLRSIFNVTEQWLIGHFSGELYFGSPSSSIITFRNTGGISLAAGLELAFRSKAAVLATSPSITAGRFQLADSGLVGMVVYPDGTNWRYEHDNSIVV